MLPSPLPLRQSASPGSLRERAGPSPRQSGFGLAGGVRGHFTPTFLLTLWRTGFQRAASGLLGDPDEAISRTAALSCGRLGLRDPHVILKLIELLNNQYPTAREQSQAA